MIETFNEPNCDSSIQKTIFYLLSKDHQNCQIDRVLYSFDSSLEYLMIYNKNLKVIHTSEIAEKSIREKADSVRIHFTHGKKI